MLDEAGNNWQHWRNERELSPLHAAVESKSADLVRLCLAKGADVNVKDSRGWYVCMTSVCQILSLQVKIDLRNKHEPFL